VTGRNPRKMSIYLKKILSSWRNIRRVNLYLEKKILRGQGELIKGEARTYKISKWLKGT
jgi:hypothetical protein